tara:strand:+ start:862 stop:1377 length:516 start_codon:yes stop_codon:yes gene_type:complete
MNWIDEANKKLEEQRANFQESLDNGDAARRGMGAGGKLAAQQLVNHKDRKKHQSNGGGTGASAKSQIKSGQIDKFIAGGQRVRDEYWANVSDEDKAKHITLLHQGLKRYSDAQRKKHEALFKDLPNIFNRNDLKQVSTNHGYKAGVQIIIKQYKDLWFTKVGHGKYQKNIK